jgi:hypothetical protein
VQDLELCEQFVQTPLGILEPSHFVFLRRQASHALSILRFLFLASGYGCGGLEDEGGKDEGTAGVEVGKE